MRSYRSCRTHHKALLPDAGVIEMGRNVAGGKLWTLVAAAIVLVVVVAVGVIAVWPRSNDSDTAATTEPVPTSDQTAPAETPVADVCQVPGETNEQPTSVPDDLTWRAQGVNSWPGSPSVGPTAPDATPAGACYQHSPMGAALAAVNILQSARSLENSDSEAVMLAQYADTPARETVIADMREVLWNLPMDQRVWGRMEGFRVVSYTPERAQILLVQYWPNDSQFTGENVVLLWQDGDWVVEAQGGVKRITVDPDSYIKWAS